MDEQNPPVVSVVRQAHQQAEPYDIRVTTVYTPATNKWHPVTELLIHGVYQQRAIWEQFEFSTEETALAMGQVIGQVQLKRMDQKLRAMFTLQQAQGSPNE